MHSRLHTIWKYQSKNADQIIAQKYEFPLMSNKKWVKLMDELSDRFDVFFIEYKLIYDEVVEGDVFSVTDCFPYFIEPIRYKEVEWIQFPRHYEDYINPNNLKAGKKMYSQNLDAIAEEINRIGKFDLEISDDNIRLNAYK